jgi:hypothetical protein
MIPHSDNDSITITYIVSIMRYFGIVFILKFIMFSIDVKAIQTSINILNHILENLKKLQNLDTRVVQHENTKQRDTFKMSINERASNNQILSTSGSPQSMASIMQVPNVTNASKSTKEVRSIYG